MQITNEMIDAGAEALRSLQQSGRFTRDWSDLPNNAKRKWRTASEAVLHAALKKDSAS